ncbi:MAG: lipocalin-like domain-containing protein [Gammaproteobacteria bacterium]
MSSGSKRLLFLLLVCLLWGGGALWWLKRESAPSERGAVVLNPSDLLSDQAHGFARATEVREFRFPQDHANHPDYRHEWWYFTGNLSTPAGRAFGYQFTLFRFALLPGEPERTSAWAPRSVYMGHLAVSDVEGKRFLTRQKLGRAAVGLAGASPEPLRVWLENWRLEGDPENGEPSRLSAAGDGVGIELRLAPEKPVVLQGDRGLSQKGAEPGNASYYYSIPRLVTEGELVLGEEKFQVAGRSWMDHEWGSSALGSDVVGWDWFALQLRDGRDLMFYHLRGKSGASDSRSAGTVVNLDGSVLPLAATDVQLSTRTRWKSPRTGIVYPIAWRLRIPSLDLTLEVEPRFAEQEWVEPVRYWEGAVTVTGDVAGEGYVELTGYDQQSTETDD